MPARGMHPIHTPSGPATGLEQVSARVTLTLDRLDGTTTCNTDGHRAAADTELA